MPKKHVVAIVTSGPDWLVESSEIPIVFRGFPRLIKTGPLNLFISFLWYSISLLENSEL